MTYIAGFVSPVPARNKDAYFKLAEDSAPLFREFGAARMVEAWGDDVPEGKLTDFYRSVKAEPAEVIVFSWHEYPSAEAAAAANEKMMADPRMEEYGKDMPFDGARMIYGGFEVVFEDGRDGKPGYVDGAVVPVKTARKDDYLAYSKATAPLFRELGALRQVDAWGADVPEGKVTDFKRAVQAGHDETVVFSFVEWPSKEVRDAAWPKVFSDPRMQIDNPPHDENRRVWGGFVPLFDK